MKKLAWLLTGLAFTACTTRPVTPTRESRHTIDTIYQKKVSLLQPQFDSVCAVYGDSIFKAAVDSMLAARLAEMNELVK